ncbi:MAG: NAD(P)H-dependent oxidoreductase [Streptococcaceae bacterium]|jgi:FMN-dependent NADH-azoreductase|nr:NAD(P)H-dependent oxidoreductase [Streptococcaceae bacterium]
MMKILQINSQPDYNNDIHSSVKLLQAGTAALKDKYPEATIETLNLYAEDFELPRINSQSVFGEVSARSRELIDQWKEADFIFIYSPLHNFNITSYLKDYIDQIFIPRETYRFTEGGSVGMMSDATTKVTFVLSSGSNYSDDIRYIAMDFAPNYLRGILSMMGIHNMKLIRAQGMDLIDADREAIVEAAKMELVNYIESL